MAKLRDEWPTALAKEVAELVERMKPEWEAERKRFEESALRRRDCWRLSGKSGALLPGNLALPRQPAHLEK
jgi:hypothetical protein